jgi:hypothetical protein
MTTISAATLALIQQAVNDQASAASADAVVVSDTQAVQAATAQEANDTALQLAAHQTSSASANAAVAGLVAELGATLPAPTVATGS